MKDTVLYIPTSDDKKIYAVLNQAGDAPAEKLLVIAHGVKGCVEEQQFVITRNYFIEKGWDVVRFAFYCGCEQDARLMKDCTLETHAQDLGTVVQNFAGQYQNIYVAGHSYGGLTTVLANIENIKAVSLWDASYGYEEPNNFWFTDVVVENGQPFLRWDSDVLVGKAMLEEGRALTREKTQAWAERFSTPVQVVLAGSKGESDGRAESLYADLGSSEKEFTAVEGANHTFSANNTAPILAEHTYNWLSKF
ncbi:MAG: hypothetical protein OXR68_06335 [Alphaproteobacteria bacterium]|nr:hypothetical protein [Alphaproteobacteria bacterium]MDD9920223.1 hypothetical protein [Alphaproteobacteria bacterium]